MHGFLKFTWSFSMLTLKYSSTDTCLRTCIFFFFFVFDFTFRLNTHHPLNQVVPALGLVWANCVTLRFILSRSSPSMRDSTYNNNNNNNNSIGNNSSSSSSSSSGSSNGATGSSKDSESGGGGKMYRSGSASGATFVHRTITVALAPHLPNIRRAFVVEEQGVRGVDDAAADGDGGGGGGGAAGAAAE